jgi:hypothetical protein
MSSIQDHGVRPIRRQVSREAYTGDPQELLERAYNDEAFFLDIGDFIAAHSTELVMGQRRKEDN